MNEFLKSKRLYMLFVLPFLVMVMAVVSVYFPLEPMNTVQVKGPVNIAFINNLSKFWLSLIGFVVALGIAYMIFFVSEKFKLLTQTTTLPSLIYVLLTSGIMVNLGFDYLLIAVFVAVLAVERLQMAINDLKTNRALFDFGFWVMLVVIIYPKFIFLILWALCVLLFSGRSTLKDIMALLFGLLTPAVFLVFYYFWTDRLALLPGIITANLMLGEHIHHLPAIELLRLGLLLFLLLVALYHLSVKYVAMIVSNRRGILALVSMLVFLSLTLFIIPGNYYDFMYMLALPLSFIYSHFFITNRWALFGNLMFGLLLFACFLTYLV